MKRAKGAIGKVSPKPSIEQLKDMPLESTLNYLSETWSKRSIPGPKDDPPRQVPSGAKASEWRLFAPVSERAPQR